VSNPVKYEQGREPGRLSCFLRPRQVGLEPFDTLTALSLAKGLSNGKPQHLYRGVDGLTSYHPSDIKIKKNGFMD
jgi:hypothetical protein